MGVLPYMVSVIRYVYKMKSIEIVRLLVILKNADGLFGSNIQFTIYPQ